MRAFAMQKIFLSEDNFYFGGASHGQHQELLSPGTAILIQAGISEISLFREVCPCVHVCF